MKTIDKMTFSAGPWSFGQENDERTIYNVTDEDLTMIVLVRGSNSRENAKLIAAAPELLESIQVGTSMAQTVIDNWSEGDLAGAIRALNEWIRDANKLVRETTTNG